MELWIHVDCKYMPPTVESLVRDIDGWAMEGATGIVFEWENMFPYPGLEAAVREDAYSCDDIRAILDACRSSGLKAVPLVQTLGHLEWLLSREEFWKYREFDDYPQQIKACDEEAAALLKGKIEALMDAHRESPYVHLGADEARRLTVIDREDCSSVKDGACAVFLRHLRPLMDQVLSKGKRPIIWADMPLSHPENIDDFPKDIVFCDWLYSQTSEIAPAAHGWALGSITADNYSDLPEDRRRLFEQYWKIDTNNYPSEFYQFPYTPFLRDRGYEVLVGPATLYAGNALAATNLPKARANERGWLRAADRFGAIGALNTCWAIRGAFREGTRTGHRAFLLQGKRIRSLPADHEISISCWKPAAGEKARVIAECVDNLNPPLDPLACTKPLYFDADNRTHRPVAYDARWESLRESLSDIEENDDRVISRKAAAERGRKSAETLASLRSESDEVKAWELGAKEMAARAEVWLAAWAARRNCAARVAPDDLAKKIDKLSEETAQFMQGRYMDADIGMVCKDRYDSLKRLLKLIGQGS